MVEDLTREHQKELAEADTLGAVTSFARAGLSSTQRAAANR